MVCLADCLGTRYKDKENAQSFKLGFRKTKELNIHQEPIKAIVFGRDLIKLGLKPSKEFKEILEFCFWFTNWWKIIKRRNNK